MAELVDALDSGSSRGNSVEVRLFLAANGQSHAYEPMKALVVANGEPPSHALLQRLAGQYELLVAVDGGFYTYIEAGLKPDLLIGDFDSISSETLLEYSAIDQLETPDQNQSDLEKAVAYLFQQGVEQLTVCGALGRRLDHTLHNIYLLCRYPEQIRFETDRELCLALPRRSEIQCAIGQTLSLIPISPPVLGVVTQGLKWELQGQALTKQFVSISNLCLKNKISISFETGDLVICLNT